MEKGELDLRGHRNLFRDDAASVHVLEADADAIVDAADDSELAAVFERVRKVGCLMLSALLLGAALARAQAIDWRDYVAQWVCLDAGGKVVGLYYPGRTGCASTRRQTEADPLLERRADWRDSNSPGNFYQYADGVMAISGDWAYQLLMFGGAPFDWSRGDGGDVYEYEPATGDVISAATEDGSEPGLLYFTGPRCNGNGWTFFRPSDMPTVPFANEATRISDSFDPLSCAGIHSAATYWYRDPALPVPFSINSVKTTIVVDAIVSEHCDPDCSRYERFIFAKGLGRIAWYAVNDIGSIPQSDIATRCENFGWNWPLSGSSVIKDCRLWTQIVKGDPTLTPLAIGWPRFAPLNR
jgi:hypothetical protein